MVARSKTRECQAEYHTIEAESRSEETFGTNDPKMPCLLHSLRSLAMRSIDEASPRADSELDVICWLE